MDSIRETMERCYRLLEKHGPRLAGFSGMPLLKTGVQREHAERLRHAPEVKARALAAFAEGKLPKQVAEELNLPPGTVGKWSIEAGYRWPSHRPVAPHAARAEAVKLLESGVPPTVVAEKLRLSVSTVGGWSYSLGLRFSRGKKARRLA